jgi:hypothetical protein
MAELLERDARLKNIARFHPDFSVDEAIARIGAKFGVRVPGAAQRGH